MRIGLNGQKLLISKLAGPEVYTLNTFKAIAKVDKKNSYVVYFDKTPDNDFWNDLSQGNPNFSYIVVPKNISWTHVGLAKELFRNHVDVFFGATHTIPVIKPKKTKFVSMIHGLEYKANKQFKSSPIKLFIHPIILWWVLVFSRLVIVPSKSTRDAIVFKNWLFVDENKIRIVAEGVNDTFYKREVGEISKIRNKYNIGFNPYFIFVSTIQPRKNIPRMIHGFSQAIKENEELKKYKILISGKLGWLYQDSLDAPKLYGVEDQVMFLGFTPNEDVPILLSGAEYFVSCSLDEGFGIPLLEAMACETPALVSNIPAFKDLGGDNQVYVNPTKIDSIKRGFLKAVENNKDKVETQEKIKSAKKSSQLYTWEKGATQLVTFFQSLMKHI